MNVGIITCHDVYNFGASLQAYALSRFLLNCNISVELIDYKPKYLYRLIDLMEVDAPKWKKNFVLRWIYRVYSAPYKLKFIKRYKRFRDFNKKLLIISKKRYRNYEELKCLMKYEKYICGSDQIWNSNKYPCGEDPSYYLAFAQGEKISYAASFGSQTISDRGAENIQKYLSEFKALSVRELSGVSILKRYNLEATHVLDPVFLLSGEEWRKLANLPRHLPERYVLVYGYDNSAELNEAVEGYVKRTRSEIISIESPIFKDAGPLEFLALIDKADMVITTSFHAVAFSIILHTPFITTMTANAELYERLEDIMNRSGLQSRRYDILKEDKQWETVKIDYGRVDQALAYARENSKKYLLNALGVEHD